MEIRRRLRLLLSLIVLLAVCGLTTACYYPYGYYPYGYYGYGYPYRYGGYHYGAYPYGGAYP